MVRSRTGEDTLLRRPGQADAFPHVSRAEADGAGPFLWAPCPLRLGFMRSLQPSLQGSVAASLLGWAIVLLMPRPRQLLIKVQCRCETSLVPEVHHLYDWGSHAARAAVSGRC